MSVDFATRAPCVVWASSEWRTAISRYEEIYIYIYIYITSSGMQFIVESLHICVVFGRYTVCAGYACICSSSWCDAWIFMLKHTWTAEEKFVAWVLGHLFGAKNGPLEEGVFQIQSGELVDRAAPHSSAPKRTTLNRTTQFRPEAHRTALDRCAPHHTVSPRSAPRRTAPHRTAPHRTAPHRTTTIWQGRRVDQWEAGIWSCDLRANERSRKKLHEKGTSKKQRNKHRNKQERKKQTHIVTTRPTRPRGPSWWKH